MGRADCVRVAFTEAVGGAVSDCAALAAAEGEAGAVAQLVSLGRAVEELPVEAVAGCVRVLEAVAVAAATLPEAGAESEGRREKLASPVADAVLLGSGVAVGLAESEVEGLAVKREEKEASSLAAAERDEGAEASAEKEALGLKGAVIDAELVGVLVRASIAEAVDWEEGDTSAEAGAVVEYSRDAVARAEGCAERVAGCEGRAVGVPARLPVEPRVASALPLPRMLTEAYVGVC